MPALPGNTAPTGSGQSFHHRKSMLKPKNSNRLFSEPTLTIVSLNIEGITKAKEDVISQLCRTHNWDIICLQETHRDENSSRPNIEGMRLVVEAPHNRYGSAIFTKNNMTITSTGKKTIDDIEILTIESGAFTVSSVYKPPGKPLNLQMPENFGKQEIRFVVGDFNCHSTSWGYNETDTNGQLLEEWVEINRLSLIHDTKLPCSFNSKIWKRGYNPDNCFVSERIQHSCIKNVYGAIPKTQHRPIGVKIYAAIKTTEIPFRRRFNFKKANWPEYSDNLDTELETLDPTPENYLTFVQILQRVSKQHIPRGCRKHFIPGLSEASKSTLNKYEKLFNKDPFDEETIACGNALMIALSEARQKKWIETLERMDMSHSSKIAWNLIKKLNGDPKESKAPSNVTPNQVANQLLLNGKPDTTCKKLRTNRSPTTEKRYFDTPFTMKELNKGLNSLKNGKAAGVDDICVEQIKHFGTVAKSWILGLFNNCRTTFQIPKLWRKAKVVAILKPGKDPESPKSYRPISLLCHLYKLYERLILHRIEKVVDSKIIPQQAGFRPGKSCTSQILALTEHIENGFEEKKITGLALVDLSSAYDTVNHRNLLQKVYATLKDYQLVKIVESLLQNRQFYVSLEGRKSRWRTQKNGLAQGSVLAPILFNLYTNDQPTPTLTRNFVYADDLGVTAQGSSFEEVEQKLKAALNLMSNYYQENSLRPNPSKTQVCAFHLQSRQAKRKLNITWNNTKLEHTEKPTYLGVTLDRSLTYRFHCEKTRKKVEARNNLLRKLSNSKWGAKPTVLRTTAQALCFSTAEYACPVWKRSAHAKQVSSGLNETCRLITGCMKPTPLDKLYKASGFSDPDSRRTAHEFAERFKQTFDDRHPLFGCEPYPGRLKSRKRFLSTILDEPPACYPLTETPQSGISSDWMTWRMLNRLRTGVAPTKSNLIRWGLLDRNDDKCDCGAIQDMEHLLACPNSPHRCTLDDLWTNNQQALDVAQYWAQKLQLPDTKK